MPIHDDEQFEGYLKGFRPLATEALPTEKRKHRRARSKAASQFAWAASAAVMLGAVMLTISSGLKHIHSSQSKQSTEGRQQSVVTPQPANIQPLTIRSANALLATAPSFKAALDEMAFPGQTTPASKGKRSALAELTKEDEKL
ncbi:MAG: hypothetical protein WAM69_06525 [Candidatus Sulfotelmatobacter sp.]